MSQVAKPPGPTPFPPESLDADALAVVARLQDAGHVTYFVGGCVRDLLVGRTPKDFDIATDAEPERLKVIFGRRCRIIGRRFRLAHVHTGGKVLEVATFRGLAADQEMSDDDTGVVVRSNVFGSPREDARSRDFTVNGMFYDPIAGEIIDYVGGRDDVDLRSLRTIGDAETRLREDPVRLLRAIKFAARLGFDIHPEIRAVSHDVAPLVSTCPMARVTEEFFRIFESGHAAHGLRLLEEHGVLAALMPEVADALADGADTRPLVLDWLGQLDRMVAAHGTPSRNAVFAFVAWPFIYPRLLAEGSPWTIDWGRFARGAIHDVSARLTIPVRHRQSLQAIATILKRYMGPRDRGPTRGQLRSSALPTALAMVRARFLVDGEGHERYEAWVGEAESHGIWAAPFEPRVDEDASPGDDPSPRRRRGAPTTREAKSDGRKTGGDASTARDAPGDEADAGDAGGEPKRRGRRRRRKREPQDG